ncbi:MAG: hypothetical protein QXS27_02570 [Candidatus Jordarchaeaceae archaeon]
MNGRDTSGREGGVSSSPHHRGCGNPEQKILGFKATSEEVPDSLAFPELLNQAQSKAKVEAVPGGRKASDTRDCFNHCSKQGVKLIFRVRRNASMKSRGSPSKGLKW